MMINQDISVYGKDNIYAFDNNIISSYYAGRIVELTGGYKSCLELGIGRGLTAGIFSNHFGRYVVLEGDRNIIDRYKKQYPDTRAEIIETYFEDYDTSEKFDVIVLGFVLEHVEYPEKILSQYARFLSSGGKLYITVPNAEALNRRVGVHAGMLKDICELSDNDIRAGHKRYYTLGTLRKEVMAEGIGLTITKEEGLFLKPLTTMQMKSLNLSKKVIDGFLDVGKYYPELCLGLMMEMEKSL